MILLLAPVAHAAEFPCDGCQLQLEKGWELLEDNVLRAPDYGRITLRSEAGDGEAVTTGDLEVEKERLVESFGAMGMVATVTSEAMRTTPLGEAVLYIDYTLEPVDDSTKVPAPRGVRLVRRCGPTLWVDGFGDPPQYQSVNKASAMVAWESPACARYNTVPFRPKKAAELALDIPQELPPAQPVPEAPSSKEGLPLPLIAAFLIFAGGLIGLAMWANKRSQVERKPLRIDPPTVGDAPAFDHLMNRVDDKKAKKNKKTSAKDQGDARRQAQDEVFRNVASAHTPSSGSRLGDALTRLDQAVLPSSMGQPYVGATGGPDDFDALAAERDGAAWGTGWLTMLGGAPGSQPEAREISRQLSGVLGGRFAIGYGGFGILVAMESDGSIVACEPYFGSVVTIGDNLEQFFSKMASDAGSRSQICDQERLNKAMEQANLTGGQVFDPGSEGVAVGLLELWSKASPLPPPGA